MSSHRDSKRGRWADHKTLRLCRQVLEALQLGIAGHCGDEVLRQVVVASVDPGSDSSRLEVTVELPEGVDPLDAFARLEKAKGLLRSLAAESISRKKVPDLLFRVAGPEPPQ